MITVCKNYLGSHREVFDPFKQWISHFGKFRNKYNAEWDNSGPSDRNQNIDNYKGKKKDCMAIIIQDLLGMKRLVWSLSYQHFR